MNKEEKMILEILKEITSLKWLSKVEKYYAMKDILRKHILWEKKPDTVKG